jgi:hypothetical protein
MFEGKGLESGILECGFPLGRLMIQPTNLTGGTLRGIVEDWESKPSERFISGKYLIINGPFVRGTAIRRGGAFFVGRMQCGTSDNCLVTVDSLSSERQFPRLPFGFTHVAEIRFSEPQEITKYEKAAELLFRTLSLMRAGWVGVIGPWLYLDDALRIVSPRVTKSSRASKNPNWCHDTVPGIFEELYGCLQRSFDVPDRGEALLTGLHWLVESQQCAGGVEGSIILQQAALEALAWSEIVQMRKLCSVSGFENLPAADKIRWLASLYSIPTAIPPHYSELVGYLKAFPHIEDLPGILVDVRNALVHGSPKKVKRLFERANGGDERTNLWWLATGLLEQAILAIAGYGGKILRRDVDAKWAWSALKQVPWAEK